MYPFIHLWVLHLCMEDSSMPQRSPISLPPSQFVGMCLLQCNKRSEIRMHFPYCHPAFPQQKLCMFMGGQGNIGWVSLLMDFPRLRPWCKWIMSHIFNIVWMGPYWLIIWVCYIYQYNHLSGPLAMEATALVLWCQIKLFELGWHKILTHFCIRSQKSHK